MVKILSGQCQFVLLITRALVTSGAVTGLAWRKGDAAPLGQQYRKGDKINILHEKRMIFCTQQNLNYLAKYTYIQ